MIFGCFHIKRNRIAGLAWRCMPVLHYSYMMEAFQLLFQESLCSSVVECPTSDTKVTGLNPVLGEYFLALVEILLKLQRLRWVCFNTRKEESMSGSGGCR